MSEQQLAVARQPVAMGAHGIELRSMDDLARFCQAIANSNLAPKDFKTPEAIMVAIQYGAEIGLAPMQALQNIAVINGRPTVWGDAAAALCRAHPQCEDIQEEVGEDGATCTAKRKGCAPVKRSFTVADAKRASLWGKAGPWQQYPKRMLQMRARSWALRDAFPDALKGVDFREEVQDYSRPEPKPAKGIVLPDEPAALNAPQTEQEFRERNPPPADMQGAEVEQDPDTGEFVWK